MFELDGPKCLSLCQQIAADIETAATDGQTVQHAVDLLTEVAQWQQQRPIKVHLITGQKVW